jgi:hypothetical protein
MPSSLRVRECYPTSVPSRLDLFAVRFARARVTDTPGRDLESRDVVGPRLTEAETFQHFEDTFVDEEDEACTVLEAVDRCRRVA